MDNNNNNNLFAYDNLNLFQNGSDSNFNDASWGVNASEYGNQARGQQLPAVNGWQQNANQLSAQSTHAGYRTVNQSPAQFNQHQFPNYGQQQQGFQAYRQSPYDHSAFTQPGSGQNFNATITPQALNRDAQANFGGSPYNNRGFSNNNFGQTPPIRPNSTQMQARPVNHQGLISSVPKGADSGMFSIINFDNLARATNSERMGNYVNVGKEPLEWGITRSVVPAYTPRKSRKELRTLASNNPTALAKIGKKPGKKEKYPTLLSDVKSASAAASSAAGVKYEQDSSSSDETSSDDDSDFTDDEEDSPLPAKRPDNPKEGVEYGTIKALWRSKRKTVSSEAVRKGLVDFWDLVKDIRDRWKKDSQDVTDAEEKKQTGQLPLLQSRVKDQRDMVEAAFRAALTHGHRGIIALLSENVSLMYLCYQFLLDRWKFDDLNGGLARAILETMSMFTTLTNDKIEKTHLGKVLNRYVKKADAKTQYFAKKILTNAIAADKEAASKSEKPKSEKSSAPDDDKKARTAPEPVAGVKRAAASSTGEGSAQKKVATAASKTSETTAASKANGVVKKTAASNDATKSNTTTTATAATRKVAAPKSSGFFSNLQSAQKKPGTTNADKAATSTTKPANKAPGSGAPKPAFSFAETMANLAKPKEEKPAAKPQKELPPETPEEREKRLRKEKRRKLHVTFKTGEDLVQVRYFTHDPQEEIGHDPSQMRDMADVGGEGRVLKQHAQMMDIDDEDDAPEEIETLREYTTPSMVDFSVVDREERKRNYAQYGGGELQPDSAERAVRDDYENNNLIVFYTDPSQIPPNPREPADIDKAEPGSKPLRYFGAPDEKYAARALAKRSQPSYGNSNNAMGGFDLSAFMKNQQQQPAQQQQSAAPFNPQIASILASLKPASNQPAQPQQPPAAFNQQYMGAQPPAPPPPQPPANIDLGAILASLNAGNNQQGNYGAPNANPMMGYGQHPQQPMMGNAGTGLSDADVAKMRAVNPHYKTRICKFWQDGRCQKGDGCSYRHD